MASRDHASGSSAIASLGGRGALTLRARWFVGGSAWQSPSCVRCIGNRCAGDLLPVSKDVRLPPGRRATTKLRTESRWPEHPPRVAILRSVSSALEPDLTTLIRCGPLSRARRRHDSETRRCTKFGEVLQPREHHVPSAHSATPAWCCSTKLDHQPLISWGGTAWSTPAPDQAYAILRSRRRS